MQLIDSDWLTEELTKMAKEWLNVGRKSRWDQEQIYEKVVVNLMAWVKEELGPSKLSEPTSFKELLEPVRRSPEYWEERYRLQVEYDNAIKMQLISLIWKEVGNGFRNPEEIQERIEAITAPKGGE